ncbi:hypothetical protein J6590_060488 [Homalodisca vitripennis]|nr:hypothetical protein J6590_060488 [Homalodisca vitripennis]
MKWKPTLACIYCAVRRLGLVSQFLTCAVHRLLLGDKQHNKLCDQCQEQSAASVHWMYTSYYWPAYTASDTEVLSGTGIKRESEAARVVISRPIRLRCRQSLLAIVSRRFCAVDSNRVADRFLQ